MYRDPVAGGRDLPQLRAARRILLLGCLSARLSRIAVPKLGNALCRHIQGLQILHFLIVAGPADVEGFINPLNMLADPFHAFADHSLISCGSLTPAPDGLPVDIDRTAVAEHRRKIRALLKPLLIGGSVSPVRADNLLKELFVLIGQVKRIVGASTDGIQLILQDAPALVHAEQRASLLAARIPDNQLVRPDRNRFLPALLAEGIRLLHAERLAFRLLEAPGQNHRILKIDGRLCIQYPLFQAVHPGHIGLFRRCRLPRLLHRHVHLCLLSGYDHLIPSFLYLTISFGGMV